MAIEYTSSPVAQAATQMRSVSPDFLLLSKLDKTLLANILKASVSLKKSVTLMSRSWYKWLTSSGFRPNNSAYCFKVSIL